MAKKNFTISTVATAPSPATSGTSLVVAAGGGALFAVNEPAIVFPVNDQPLVANAEIVMVTNVATDTLTITRTQESTSARTIVEGDIIIQGITAKDWNDLITSVAGKITAFADPNADRIVFWDDSEGTFAALTASTGLTLSGTTLTVRAASETATGIVERATDAEFTNGTDTTRFINTKQAASVAQTMTNKTLTSPVLNTGVSGTAVLDEDDMASNSATQLATQQSIKAYVDAKGFVWKGPWATSTGYLVNDTVESNGSGYVCTSAHTSGATTEPGVGTSWTDKWDLFVEGLPEPNLTTATTTNLTGYLYGDGTNIASKGTIDGWIPAGETWTYASATTITVPSGAASLYQKGDKIKITNNSATKYFYVVGVADTVLTVTGGSDYTVHDSAITNPYFSKIENPQGFPHWFNYTPSYSASGSMTFTSTSTLLAKFRVAGSEVHALVSCSGTIGGTPAADLRATLPIAADFSGGIVSGWAICNNAFDRVGMCKVDDANDWLQIRQYDAANWSAGTRYFHVGCIYPI